MQIGGVCISAEATHRHDRTECGPGSLRHRRYAPLVLAASTRRRQTGLRLRAPKGAPVRYSSWALRPPLTRCFAGSHPARFLPRMASSLWLSQTVSVTWHAATAPCGAINKTLAGECAPMPDLWRETIAGEINCHAVRATQLRRPIAGCGVRSTGRKRIGPDVAGTVLSDAKTTKATNAGTTISETTRRELQGGEQKDCQSKAEQSMGRHAVRAKRFRSPDQATMSLAACLNGRHPFGGSTRKITAVH